MRRAHRQDEAAVGAALVEAFRTRGFAGASLRELQSATGLGSASLYHRFAGKEAMAAAATAHVGASFGPAVIAPLGRDAPPAVRLAASADGVRRFYDEGRLACLLAVFTLSDAPPSVRDAVAAAFAGWREALTRTLDEAGVERPDDAAADRIAAIQGGLLLARATGERGVFERAVARLEAVA